VLAGAVAVVVANRSELPQAWGVLRSADPAWLALAALCSGLFMVDLAAKQAAAQRVVGLEGRTVSLLPVAQAGNFLNLVTKSGGMAGLAAFTGAARKRGLRRGPVVAAYMIVAVLDMVAFGVVLVAALVGLAVNGHFGTSDAVAAAVFAVYLSVTVGSVGAAFRSRASVRAVFALPRRITTAARRALGRPSKEPADDHERADELYDSIEELRRHPRGLWAPALAALAVDLLGIAQLWAVLLAVGAAPSPSVPLVAYCVSTLFGIVGFLPGGLGFVELSLGGVLVQLGIPVAVGAAAVVLFRLTEFWVPLAVGSLAARRVLVAEPR
jgi:uncharacterized protein (TIRG00374 family)